MSLDCGEGGDIDSGGEDGYVGADKDNGNVPTPLSTLTHHHKKSPSSSFSEVKFVGERVSDKFYQAQFGINFDGNYKL